MGDTNQAGDAPAVLHGGRGSVAHFIDGAHEEVFVRCPPLRELQKYLDLSDDIPALVEFVCQKPEGWGDCLQDDSLYQLFHLARELNDPRLGRWIQAQRQTAESLRARLEPEPHSPASPPGL